VTRRGVALRFCVINQTALPPGKSETAALNDVVEQIVCAEALGYEGFWLTEHHFGEYGMACLEPILGYAAAKTQRIRLGSSVWVTPLHHPIRLAENIAGLDILSGGRINFGVGRGYVTEEFKGFDVDILENKPLHDEVVDIVLTAWTEECFSYQGRYWKIPPTTLHPKPLQKPYPPIYQPLISPGSIEDAVAKGRNAIFGPRFQNLELVSKQMHAWQSATAKAGKRLDAVVTLPVYVGESEADSRSVLAEPLMWIKQKWVEQMEQMPDADTGPRAEMKEKIGKMNFAEAYETCIVGDARLVTEKLRWLEHNAGVEHVLCSMHFGSLPQERILKSMELMARHVIPNFQN
jgi:alkanesulfonate monooxygenase SsuD/methylene tetrahydromethanopterin reductase-like flavin-dependent oxidoreductase (luciferase family)